MEEKELKELRRKYPLRRDRVSVKQMIQSIPPGDSRTWSLSEINVQLFRNKIHELNSDEKVRYIKYKTETDTVKGLFIVTHQTL